MGKIEAKKDLMPYRRCNGVPYDIVGDEVVIHFEDREHVTLPLELGRSAYQVVYAYINRKDPAEKKARATKGFSTIGNFTYKVENNIVTVFRKDGSILGEPFEMEADKALSSSGVRSKAMAFVLATLE